MSRSYTSSPPAPSRCVVGLLYIMLSAGMKLRNKTKFRYGIPAHTGPIRGLITVYLNQRSSDCVLWHSKTDKPKSQTKVILRNVQLRVSARRSETCFIIRHAVHNLLPWCECGCLAADCWLPSGNSLAHLACNTQQYLGGYSADSLHIREKITILCLSQSVLEMEN
jgi:hypothetical protein